MKRPAKARNPEVGHGRLSHVSPTRLYPSPENDALYRRVLPTDAAIVELAESIRERGVVEPLVATADRLIVSGHRRWSAAIVAGVATVPVRYLAESRADFSTDDFVALLREHNRQRVKNVGEAIREAVVDADPEEAYVDLRDAASRSSRTC